jgi:Spy/CpxP family protein refolding chaperone
VKTMMKSKKALAGMALLVVVGFVGLAGAAQQRRNAQRAAGMGGPAILNLRGIVGRLNLTADQRGQLKTVLAVHKPQILDAAKRVLQSRIDLENAARNNGDLRGAAAVSADAQVNAIQLKQQILEEIKSKNILTADQIATLQQMQQAREQRLQQRLARIDRQLGK